MDRYDIALGKLPLNNILDAQGRIIEYKQGHIGHSVCNTCGKDMPGCWDVVCNCCKKTFCYECSVVWAGYWNCMNCNRAYNKA